MAIRCLSVLEKKTGLKLGMTAVKDEGDVGGGFMALIDREGHAQRVKIPAHSILCIMSVTNQE